MARWERRQGRSRMTAGRGRTGTVGAVERDEARDQQAPGQEGGAPAGAELRDPAHDDQGPGGQAQVTSTLRADLAERTGVLVVGAEWVPVWRLLRGELADEPGVWFADADADPVGADQLGVRTLPTCIVLVAGREQRRVTAAVSADDLRSWATGVRGDGVGARSGHEDPSRDRRRPGAR